MTEHPAVLGVKATVSIGRHRILVGYLPAEGWWCDCPKRGDCEHLAAVRALISDGA